MDGCAALWDFMCIAKVFVYMIFFFIVSLKAEEASAMRKHPE